MGKIAIIGLGLIGASMGLALKRAEPVKTEIVGFDKNVDSGTTAHKMGAVQFLAGSVEEAVDGATMIIVAVPIISIRTVFETIAPRLQKGAVVTDTASTKTDVLRWARDTLPAGVHFVGGHPMAGKENSGPGSAVPDLFVGRPYAIVSPGDVMPGAVSAVENLVKAVEGQPLFLEAAEHDSYAAAISHVPLLASIGLFNLARTSAAWPELANMAGPGFRDLTRLASGEPAMAHDICLTNRENILHWIERYIVELRRLADQVEEADPEKLYRVLAETQMERDTFLVSPPKRDQEKGELDLPSSNESFMDTMIGGYWRTRANEMTSALEERAKARTREERLRRRE